MSSLEARGAMAAGAIELLRPAHWEGRVTAVLGHSAEILGMSRHLSLGARINVHSRHGSSTTAEVVALRGEVTHSTAFAAIRGLGVGGSASASIDDSPIGLPVSEAWIGRVVDPFGQPLDGGPPPEAGSSRREVQGGPPEATMRARLGERISLGVRAMDLFATCRHGLRIGLFAGTGVGKSTLLAMLARNVACDVSVVVLVGERGREVREFIEDDLGSAGLARAVVVVATSDVSPLIRREAGHAAITIAEHFRDCGKKVLLLMDSATRFCHALREIALSAGEPPVSRGFPPIVFAELARLLERAGPGLKAPTPAGQITAFFTVLAEGDDQNEPIADNVRGLLDGHVVLDRRIAEQGRFPAVDVARTHSRAVPGCNSLTENSLLLKARRILATYSDAADLVRLGAYRAGSDASVDEALMAAPRIEALLCQRRDERTDIIEAFQQLHLAIR
jgi:flagellum-specific ATP synthase